MNKKYYEKIIKRNNTYVYKNKQFKRRKGSNINKYR